VEAHQRLAGKTSGAWSCVYDRSLTIYGAFFHIACFMIVLRRVVQ